MSAPERIRVAAEVRRVRQEMSELGFSQADVREEVERVKALRLQTAPEPNTRWARSGSRCRS